MNVLVDTNVILDVLLERHPFYKDSFVIFQLVDQNSIRGHLSAASMTDIFYLLRKSKYSVTELYPVMDDLATFFKVAPVNEITIINALALRWKDFEDAVQYMVAKENDIECIITRNAADYEASSIVCMSPTEFIDSFKVKD